MSDYENVEAVRAMSEDKLSRLNRTQLARALTTLLNAEQNEEPSNADLLNELRVIKESVKEINKIKEEVKSLTDKLEYAFQVIHQQQLFLESLDNKERRRNLVITGVSENADTTGANDVEKLRNVLTATGCAIAIDPSTFTVRRLGQTNTTRPRPIHVTVELPQQRDTIIEKAKNLKNAGESYSRIYIKKDIHPVVRKEIGRLRKRERDEKNKPENTSVNISYDGKNRVLLRDGIIIDRFTPKFF